MNTNKMYHINLDKDDISGAKYAIVPGDPDRVEKIAAFLDNPRKLAQKREYNSYIGSLCGQNIIVTSTGIGGPSAAIAVEELAMLGVENFIRVGTCGGMQRSVMPGDIIIGNASIRMDGTSLEYLPIEYPAVSNFDLTCALRDAAKNMQLPYHVGVVQSKDSFYGQHSPDRMPVSAELKAKWQAWIAAGCLASEMESSTLYTVASSLGLRASSVFCCIWNQERINAGLIDPEAKNTETAIKVAIEAIKLLILG